MKKADIVAVLFMAVCTAAFALALVLSACSAGPGDLTKLPVQTIQWAESGDGYFQFYTNDENNFGNIYLGDIAGTNDLNEFEIECIRKSGAIGFEYGLIFDHVNSGQDQLFSTAGITSNGAYTIWEYSSGDWVNINNNDKFGDEDFDGYTQTPKIFQGLNKVNKIKMNRADDDIILSLNGKEVWKGNKPRIDGNYGFFVIVGTEKYEKFPNTPVDVRFRVLTATPSE